MSSALMITSNSSIAPCVKGFQSSWFYCSMAHHTSLISFTNITEDLRVWLEMQIHPLTRKVNPCAYWVKKGKQDTVQVGAKLLLRSTCFQHVSIKSRECTGSSGRGRVGRQYNIGISFPQSHSESILEQLILTSKMLCSPNLIPF